METNNIVFIADPEILAIPIRDCQEPLVDVRDAKELAYGPVPECPETVDCFTKMRETVYAKILAAQKELPNDWRFRLYEGFRSIEVQTLLFNNMHEITSKRFPELSDEDLFHETTRLVSPVVNFDGSLNTPVHNTGAAIDIEIIEADGTVVDMGMAAKDWCDVPPELCRTNYQDLPQEVRRNRQILHDVMTAHGFINYPTEWWHFSYGDRYWAYQTKSDFAIYGSADLL